MRGRGAQNSEHRTKRAEDKKVREANSYKTNNSERRAREGMSSRRRRQREENESKTKNSERRAREGNELKTKPVKKKNFVGNKQHRTEHERRK